MLFFLFLLSLLYQTVYSQTACKFFSSSNHNYTAWSESHIDTWCRDHDPFYTSQCATVLWPPYYPFPGRVNFRHNIREWFLQIPPRIGTRQDCIARSSALDINSTTHENGLIEAVTCDLYYFHPQRRQECVCFPVYNDHVMVFTTVVHDVLHQITTTSVFYPPDQIVERYLLAAATQGAPTLCNPTRSTCRRSVHVISRKPRILGGFPYCPTPAQRMQQQLAARTPAPKKDESSSKRSSKNSSSCCPTWWPPLPTARPDCKTPPCKRLVSSCRDEECMWSFLCPYSSTSHSRVTTINTTDGSTNTTWLENISYVTKQHWGTAMSFEKSQQVDTSPYDFEFDESEASMLNPGHAQLGQNGTHSHSPLLPASSPRPVCESASDCRCWCQLRHDGMKKSYISLLAIGSGLSGVAVLGLLLTVYGPRMRRLCATAHDRRKQKAGEAQDLDLVRATDEQTPQRPKPTRTGKEQVRFQGVDGSSDTPVRSRQGLIRISEHRSCSSPA